MAVPPVILVEHCVAMGPSPGLPCLCIVAPPAPIWIRRTFRAIGQAPLLPAPPHRCPERECAAAEVGSPGHRNVGVAGPPQRRTTSPPGCSAVGFRPSRPPIAGSLLRAAGPTVLFPLSATSSSAMERDDAATEGGSGAVNPPRWSSDVARNTPQPALLCLSVPLSF